MNKWTSKSLKLVLKKGYLDKLFEIYPAIDKPRNLKVNNESKNLKEIYDRKNCNELIRELIRLKNAGFKFPIDNPYISFLGIHPESIDSNPKTLERICEILFKMDYDIIKSKLESPKSASRRIGPMFRKWLKSNFDFCDKEEFEKNYNLSFLNYGDKKLKLYAEDYLKCNFIEYSKGLDFIAKIKKNYIIGTAKFITDFGGSQKNQFSEAMHLIRSTKSPQNIIKIAVIDGVAWLRGEMKLNIESLSENEYCLSALLFNDFLSSFK